MQAKLSESVGSVGYLDTTESEPIGFYGALLVVSENARPVEFHCTQPIRPKPAQKVLYGATLSPSLLADQIPRALLNKSRSKLGLILVNDPKLMALRNLIEIPMALIGESGSPATSSENSGASIAADHQLVIGDLSFFSFENIEVAVSRSHDSDQDIVRQALISISRSVDVDEPFERLTIAMEETCKSSQSAA